MVRGDAGIGKSALLRAAVEELSGVRVVRADGHETQTSLPFAAIRRLALALATHVPRLPTRQAVALRVAVGAQEGPAPERSLVGLAVLDLLARAARDRPVVVVADDAHWLDPESLDVLMFVARRLGTESVVLVAALRDDPATDARVAGIPALRLRGLRAADASDLVTAISGRPLEPRAAARLVSATGGNPLALIDLAGPWGVGDLLVVPWADDPVPVSRRLEDHYLRQVRALPASARRWLLVAAVASLGRVDLVRSATRRLGGRHGDGRVAEAAGLVRVRDCVRFRHPLVRAAACSAATPDERRAAHLALAATSERYGLVDVAAWHRAEAASGVDERVACLLEDAARRAGARGAVVTQASLLARAADLTPPGAERAERLLEAAAAASASGDARLAGDLLDRTAADDLDPVQQGRAIVTRYALATGDALAARATDPADVAGATAQLVRAADLFRGRAPEREQEALLRAYELSLSAGASMAAITLPELGRRLRQGAASAPGPAAVVLEALASLLVDPFPVAVPRLRAALETIGRLDDGGALRFACLGATLASALWDARAGSAALDRAAGVARGLGALPRLHVLLGTAARAAVERGDPAAGAACLDEAREVRDALGDEAERVPDVGVLAWTGGPRTEVEAATDALVVLGLGGPHTVAVTALAARDTAEGRYVDAYGRLEPLVARRQVHLVHHQLPELVEAAARSGHPDVARAATTELELVARACGSPWAHGVADRCRALVGPDQEAETRYRGAIALLSLSGTPVDLARTHLLYGEWLRRAQLRAHARVELRAALAILEAVRAPAFAARARTELEATGESAPCRDRDVGDPQLTPREWAVARMAAAGSSNAEIGAMLFVSPSTVEHHLRTVFRALGVTSRRRLGKRLESQPAGRRPTPSRPRAG